MAFARFETTTPPDGGSLDAAVERNNFNALFQGDRVGLWPRAQSTPDMTIAVGGTLASNYYSQVYNGDVSGGPLIYSSAASPAMTAPVADPRIDVVYWDTSGGAVAIITGVENASPSPNYSTLAADDIPICEIYHRTTATFIVDFEDSAANPNESYIYRDVRPFLRAATGIVSGMMVVWNGAISAIPAGWQICDGTNGTTDMTDRFLIHADADAAGTYNPGDTGGAHTVALVTANIEAHAHTAGSLAVSGSTDNENAHTHAGVFDQSGAIADTGHTGVTNRHGANSTAAGSAHQHALTGVTIGGNTGNAGSGTAHENKPKFIAKPWIMKL